MKYSNRRTRKKNILYYLRKYLLFLRKFKIFCIISGQYFLKKKKQIKSCLPPNYVGQSPVLNNVVSTVHDCIVVCDGQIQTSICCRERLCKYLDFYYCCLLSSITCLLCGGGSPLTPLKNKPSKKNQKTQTLSGYTVHASWATVNSNNP